MVPRCRGFRTSLDGVATAVARRTLFARLRPLAMLMVALAAPALARADGQVEVAWEQCRGEPGALLDRTLACEGVVPPLRLVVTIKPDVTIPDFVEVGMRFTIGPVVSSWWTFQPGGCRAGALALGDPASASCANPYQGASTTGSLDYVSGSKYLGFLEFDVRITRASPVELAASSDGYVAAVLEIDAADVTAVGCSGCAQPMCLGLQGAVATGQSGSFCVMAPLDPGNFVTWQGGYIGCSGLVPTRKPTWGHLKTIYR